MMSVVPTSKSNMDEKVRLVDNDVPDDCVLCTEKTIPICGVRVKRWCLLLVLLSAALTSATLIAVIYALRLQTLTACRLTYSNNATIHESEMQTWAAQDDWPLSVPRYDPWRRTCVCAGYETKDPKELQLTDEVLVWVAPGDLITLADSGKIRHFNAEFESTYKGDFSENNHVKVCLQQQFLLELWAYRNTTDQTSCHSSSGPSGSIIERFYLGWDGALFCASSADNIIQCSSLTTSNPLKYGQTCQCRSWWLFGTHYWYARFDSAGRATCNSQSTGQGDSVTVYNKCPKMVPTFVTTSSYWKWICADCNSTEDCASDEYCDTDYKCKSSPVGKSCTDSITLGIDNIKYDCCCPNKNVVCAFYAGTSVCGCCPPNEVYWAPNAIGSVGQYACNVAPDQTNYQKTCGEKWACSALKDVTCPYTAAVD
jgi:hypothetical protein